MGLLAHTKHHVTPRTISKRDHELSSISLTLCPGNATSGFIVIAILATDCAAKSAPFSVFWAAREINA